MKYLYLSLIAFILFLSCQKDLKEQGAITNPNPDYIKTSIQGKVLDEKQNPVAGSTVVFGKSTATTNDKGIFRMDSVEIDINATVVKVSKAGYFNGFRTFVAGKGILNFIQVELIPQNKAGKFSSNTGGSVNIPNGGTISFPAGGIVRASDNVAYAGNVNVSAHFIDPSLPNLPDAMPGDLRGITLTGETRGLQSFGMVAVELTDDAGVKLQLAVNNPATITLPVPTSLAGTAPASIPIWYFDETRGIWKEEGTATKTGSNYVFSVKHFSFWNCDAPFPIVKFEALVLSVKGAPLVNARVAVKIVSNSSTTYGCTDSTGKIAGSIPSGQALEIKIYDRCGGEMYKQNIGPFTQATNLGTLSVGIPYSGNVIISGKAINCAGNAVARGIARISLGEYNYSTNVVNGSFSISIDRCDVSPATAYISITDIDSLKQSAPSSLIVSAGSFDAGNIAVCDKAVAEFFEININGTAYNLFGGPTDSFYLYKASSTSTTISAALSGNNKNMYLSGSISGAAVGQFPFKITSLSAQDSRYSDIDSVKLTFTSYGNKGEFATANFSGKMVKDTSKQVPVSGQFRIKIK